MEPRHLAELRAERLIACGRLLLASLSLLALVVGRPGPQRLAVAYGVAGAYVVFAATLAAASLSTRPRLLAWRLPAHVVDVATAAAMVLFTSGATSPFYGFLVFAVVAAALRWRWVGVLATAAAALAAYIVIGLRSLEPGATPADLLTFGTRCVYLLVVAILLAYLGTFQWGLRRELEELASWPAAFERDPMVLAALLLERSARLFGVERAALLWEDPEEPWLLLVRRSRVAVSSERLPPDAVAPGVAPSLARCGFVASTPTSPAARTLCLEDGVLRRVQGQALDESFARRLGLEVGHLLAIPLEGQLVQGRFFAVREARFGHDDLTLGGVLAHHLSAQLDQSYLALREQRDAADRERMRLARDLHDGVIQSLTGASLRLRAIDRLLEERPAEARQLLSDIDELLLSEQQELRWFLTEARGHDWLERLAELGERMERTWGLSVEVETALAESDLPEGLGHEVYRLVQEALVNAARHGRATHAKAILAGEANGLRISVSDDGHGFPFQGEFDDATLRRGKMGPVSIKQRVAALGGSLHISSREDGARLEIVLPREET
jgi:signal transduction histidine kinase